MTPEPIEVTVDGKPVRLFRGAHVKHALNAAGEGGMIAKVMAGKAVVWDETAGAETDLSGALYPGQKLAVRDM